jgi:hypothetical protein
MWVHPNRFNVLKWPLRLFRTIMGGRYPHSKRGIVRHFPMEIPAELTGQLTWRLEELADRLGYEVIPKGSLAARSFSQAMTSIDFEGVRAPLTVATIASEFGGVRE